MYILIAGGGKIGSFLTYDLSRKGHTVVLMERRTERCQKNSEKNPDALIINGDACDIKVMEEAQADRADVLAAVTGDDDDNLVICQLAKESFRIPRIIARINDPRNENIFREVGVKNAISSTIIIAQLIEGEASFGELKTLQVLERGNFALVETEIPLNSPLNGLKVSEIGFPKECVLVAVIHEEKVIVPRGNTILSAGNKIIAFTAVDKEKVLRDIITGKLKPKACSL